MGVFRDGIHDGTGLGRMFRDKTGIGLDYLERVPYHELLI